MCESLLKHRGPGLGLLKATFNGKNFICGMKFGHDILDSRLSYGKVQSLYPTWAWIDTGS